MTLIPLISAIVGAPETMTAPVGTATPARGGYDPGAGHRPVAAVLALGLPAVLVVAVALSPMVVDTAPIVKPTEWTSITLPRPTPPDPQPDARPQPERQQERVTTVDKRLPPLAQDTIVVPPQPPYVPPAGTGTGTAPPADPPAPPPKLVLAELDGRYLGAFQPAYPANEQRREIEGSVRVRVLIGTDGRVKAVELVSSDSPGFFEETKRRALSRWRFTPATRGGVPEESWKVMTVRFQIRGA